MTREATHRQVEKPRKPATMPEETAEREEPAGPRTNYLDEHEWPRLTAGIAAAAGAGMLAVSLIGVGPAAVVGAAGYLAYRELTGKRSKATSETEEHR